jgi:nucleotide-binding universal stress UspA family protein
VKVKPLLARLQNTIGRYDLIDQMVLLPESTKSIDQQDSPKKSINLIVGYNASPNSHTALDIAFCIAHQTHLATNIQVNVQAVYVSEENTISHDYHNLNFPHNQLVAKYPTGDLSVSKSRVLTPLKPELVSTSIAAKADRIIWQAKTLAEEWQSYFKSHLRFGNLSSELRKVAELEAADALVLGCQSADHPLIDSLGGNFPCAVLGIPNCLD